MIDTEEALKLFYKGQDDLGVVNETAGAFEEVENPPADDMQTSSFYSSEFEFGDTDSGVIHGITYFAIILKNVASVTAEIKVDGEAYKFTFDGGGP